MQTLRSRVVFWPVLVAVWGWGLGSSQGLGWVFALTFIPNRKPEQPTNLKTLFPDCNGASFFGVVLVGATQIVGVPCACVNPFVNTD